MKVPLKKSQRVKVSNPKDIYTIMQKILLRENKLNRKREHLWSIGLDDDLTITYIELLAIGSENKAILKVKDILRMAIYKDASMMILVHNHPSGHLTPSDADKDLTEALKHGGNFTGIKLMDHLIINQKSFFSFADNRLLK